MRAAAVQGLAEWSVQAVDGTKIGSPANRWTLTRKQLTHVDWASSHEIADMEEVNDPSIAAIPRRFGVRLREARLTRQRLRGSGTSDAARVSASSA